MESPEGIAPEGSPPNNALEKARSARAQLVARLQDENETQLAETLEKCGEKFTLVCTSCGHRTLAEKRCRQKWCPVCVRGIAAKRAAKFQQASTRMQWPLFVTLTVRNTADSGEPFVRKLRRDFGKFRRTKFWRDRVKGGVAGIEVTNKGKGWHPHIHALIDCRWLSTTPRPQHGESKQNVARKCEAAKRELTRMWKKTIREKNAITWVQRCNGTTAVTEVLKYSVKGSDLLASTDAIGPLIHQLRATRLTTSFGSMFGLRITEMDNPRPCENCGNFEHLPDFVIDMQLRKR
ncbi:MAG: protein rep [Limisphaerales bacterium]